MREGSEPAIHVLEKKEEFTGLINIHGVGRSLLCSQIFKEAHQAYVR